jgi:hypothetical protein
MSSSNIDIINRWAWPPFSRISRSMIQIWPLKESFIAWPTDSFRDEDADLIPNIFNRMVDQASRSITGRRIF